jgi:hypothetical protein
MSIIREFEVFLTETACCFRCCLSVVSVVLVVRLDSFGKAWHLFVNLCNIIINLRVVLLGLCLVDVVCGVLKADRHHSALQ